MPLNGPTDRREAYTPEQQARFDERHASLDGFGLSAAIVNQEAHWHAMGYEPPEIRVSAPATPRADTPATAPVSRFDRAPLDWKVLGDGEPPAREWAIGGWFGMGHATLLAGAGGIGKSLLAQQIGSALALGRDFIGPVSQARRALLWAAEDDHDELWRRQIAIAAYLNAPLDAFAGRLFVESFVDRDCTLMDCGDFGGRLIATPMLDELREQVADYAADVVILDNVARIFGGKEADRGHVTRFVTAVVGACQRAAVMLLAHPGRATGSEFSGSSAWEASVRTRLYLGDKPPDQADGDEGDAPPGLRYLARRKRNYAGPDLRTFTYRDGVLVPDHPAGESWLVDGLRDRKAERVALAAFRRLVAIGQHPSDGATSPAFLPKLALQFDLAEGMTRRELADAMRRLMLAGQLRREAIGKYPNRAPRFGLVASPETAP